MCFGSREGQTARCKVTVIRCIPDRSDGRELYHLSMTGTSETRSRIWLWSVAVWFGFGLVDAVQTIFVMHEQGMHHVWIKLFVVTIFFWTPWAVATAPVIHLGLRFPPVRWKSVKTWVVHLSGIFRDWSCVHGVDDMAGKIFRHIRQQLEHRFL